MTAEAVAAFFERERKRMYDLKHPSACECVVCWSAEFHRQMTERNETRASRCRAVLANPELALTPAPELSPVQVSFFAQLDEVAQ
ncbi:hypothetical protein [Halopseudomonas sp.]|uniref:hypothetical protein n=1 Tax=Halopseudomonas sp. TaxID=2901191 RepID=UPI003002015B